MSPVITAIDLTKNFGTLTALAQVNLAVAPGTVFGLVGPNGAGKTTMVRLLNGLLQPTDGGAIVLGHDVARDGQHVRQRCGVQTDTNIYERPAQKKFLEVVARKNFGGNHSGRGAKTQAVMMTIFFTLALHGQDEVKTVVQMIEEYLQNGQVAKLKALSPSND